MKEIKMLAGMIREEMCDAEKYAKDAITYKATEPELAKMFYELSTQELTHANMEHEQAVRLIKNQKTPAPESMQAVWEWEHDNMIDDEARIRMLLDMYKK